MMGNTFQVLTFHLCKHSKIAAEIFAPGSGISDDEIRKVLKLRVSSQTFDDLHAQIAAENKIITLLKENLIAITKGKNEFIIRAIEAKNGVPYSHLKKISDEIFSPGSGISDDEIRKLMRLRISSKDMEPNQQVAAGNKVIKRIKETSKAMIKGKNEFKIRAIAAEKSYCVKRKEEQDKQK